MKQQNKSAFIIGMALFAMFFGSGNITFPMYVGQFSSNNWQLATIGFCISAVLLPFLGILAVMHYQGNTHLFFHKSGRFLGGKWLIPLFLTAWIPFGSGPRCITVAYGAIKSYMPFLTLWEFSLIFCLLAWIILHHRNLFLSILGKYLTPFLLLSLFTLFIVGLLQKKPISQENIQASNIFSKSLLEGYNTMDMIAGCFFTSSVMNLIKQSKNYNKNPNKLALSSGMVGVIILSLVYMGMIFLSSKFSVKIAHVNKEEMLPFLAQHLLGNQFGCISSVIIMLACISTLSALIMVYVDYLESLPIKSLKKEKKTKLGVLIVIYLISLMGFEKLGTIIEPVLKVLYPVLLILVLITMLKKALPYFRKETCLE